MSRTRLISLLLLLFSPVCLGQQANAPAQPNAAATVPPATKNEASGVASEPVEPAVVMKKSVAFLSVSYRRDGSYKEARGTAFFVFYPDKRLGEDRGFVYLVTNRHLATPSDGDKVFTAIRTSLRLNLRHPQNGSQSAEGQLPIGGLLRWYFPDDESVDLAVLPLALDQSKYDYEPIPVSFFAGKDVIKSEGIAEGYNVMFAGFFYQYPGQTKIQPIVRQGVLAMMSDEKLTTTLGKAGNVYLADAHVFGGNSGAPLFVHIAGFRGGGMRLVGGFPFRLLGVVSGYFTEEEDLKLEAATDISGTVKANSGISIVVPADELQNLLDSPILVQVREREVANVNKKP